MNRFCLLTAALGLLSITAEAQIAQGTRLLGGSAGYGRSTSTSTFRNPSSSVPQPDYEQTSRSFSVSPRAGLFLADNLAAGVSIGYNSQKSTNPYYDYSSSAAPVVYQQTGRSNSFSVAPFLRYYYLPTAVFGVFGQLTASYSMGKNKVENTAPYQPSGEDKSHGFNVGISPALVFFPIDKLGLELAFGSIGYGRSTSKAEAVGNQLESKSTSSGFGANFGFDQLSVGASYYFGR